MKTMDDISDYYRSNRPFEQVRDVLGKRYGKGKPLDVNDLAAVDSFHLRGRAATVSLAASVGLQPGLSVLDVGSGPGGTARYLAEHFGARVVGLDLTFEFTRLASFISDKTGMMASTHFTCASALSMPFADACFDGVWMEHVQMNIPDKARLAAEIFRVLKPSGFLAMYEVFHSGSHSPDYPLPWAEDPSCSQLTSPETMQTHLQTAGFAMGRWHDCLEDIRLWFEKRAAKHKPADKPQWDVRLLMGENADKKVRNLTIAVMDKRLTVVEGICRKP